MNATPTKRQALLNALNAALAATPDAERSELQQAAMDYRATYNAVTPTGLLALIMDALVYAD